ncbi:MAG: hypothetical protein ACK4E3_03570 [Brevundimonas sp.]|uniref:hypothetical protein n=1 Tax=Brevundimonas sp. TaxID=1871086 RepID=UPI0039198D2A
MADFREYVPDGLELQRYLASAPYSNPAAYWKALACIQGPIRSGTSVASCQRLMEAAMNVPAIDGVRRSRWLIVRNTYPDLEQSTIKTWLDWFPEKTYGRFYWSTPYVHEVRIGDVEADFVFESFSGDDDIHKLPSREYTGAWINEAQFYSLRFCVTLLGRTGYYPLPSGPKFLQLDMNAPPHGHWVPMMRGDVPIPEEMTENERISLRQPADWAFYVQPPWLLEKKGPNGEILGYDINPDAENLRVMGEKAVRALISGRTRDQIDAELMNRVLILQPGRPVFPQFSRDFHVSKTPLPPVPGARLIVGFDFGRQPAMVVAQCVGGLWTVLDELLGSNTSAVEFAPLCRRRLAQKFPEWMQEDGPGVDFWGDPSGSNRRSETDEHTAFEIFEMNGMRIQKADNAGRRGVRIETMTSVLNANVEGRPRLLLSSTCVNLITGFAGGYCFRRKRVSGSPVYEDEPDKNSPYSHPMDALMEILMGGGESRVMLGQSMAPPKRMSAIRKISPFSRPGRRFG